MRTTCYLVFNGIEILIFPVKKSFQNLGSYMQRRKSSRVGVTMQGSRLLSRKSNNSESWKALRKLVRHSRKRNRSHGRRLRIFYFRSARKNGMTFLHLKVQTKDTFWKPASWNRVWSWYDILTLWVIGNRWMPNCGIRVRKKIDTTFLIFFLFYHILQGVMLFSRRHGAQCRLSI